MDKTLFAKLTTLTSEAEVNKERRATEKAEQIIANNTPAMLQAATMVLMLIPSSFLPMILPRRTIIPLRNFKRFLILITLQLNISKIIQ